MNLCKIRTHLAEQISKSFSIRVIVTTLVSIVSWGIGGLSWGSLGCGSRASGSIGVRVSDTVLQLLYLRPAVLSLNGNSQNLLVAVDNGVHDRWKGGEVGSQRDSSDGGDRA